jgi:hypothetical protein
VGEINVETVFEVGFNAFPVLFFVPDLLAVGTDRNQPPQFDELVDLLENQDDQPFTFELEGGGGNQEVHFAAGIPLLKNHPGCAPDNPLPLMGRYDGIADHTRLAGGTPAAPGGIVGSAQTVQNLASPPPVHGFRPGAKERPRGLVCQDDPHVVVDDQDRHGLGVENL